MLEVKVGQTTHAGRVRQENQDKIGVIDCSIGYAFILADGMGGHRGGATAAAVVVKSIQSDLGKAQPDADPTTVITEAIQTANLTVHRQATGGDAELKGMGSTVVVALINGQTLLLAHVGDSRAYLLRGGELKRLTKDHTIVQGLVDAGFLTEKQAREHPNASVLSRAMGHGETVDVDVAKPTALEAGDMLLMCSDGLSSYVPETEILNALVKPQAPQEIADRLKDLALDAGGRDNVSVFCIRFQEATVPAAVATPAAVVTPAGSRSKWIGIAAAAVLAVAGIVGYQSSSTPVATTERAAPPAAPVAAAVPAAEAPAPVAPPPVEATLAKPVEKKAPEPKPAAKAPAEKPKGRVVVVYFEDGPTERSASALVRKLRGTYPALQVLPVARKSAEDLPQKVSVFFASEGSAGQAAAIATSLSAAGATARGSSKVAEEYRAADVVVVVPKAPSR